MVTSLPMVINFWIKHKQRIIFALLLSFSVVVSCFAFRGLNASSIAFRHGESLLSQGNVTEALKSFHIAAATSGLRPPLALKLAHAAFLAGDTTLCKNVLTGIISSQSRLTPDVLNAVAGRFDSLEMPLMALTALRRAGDAVVESEPSALYLAELESRVGDVVASEMLYRHILNKNSDNIAASLGLAQLLAWHGRVQEAETLCESVLDRNPHNRKARLVLGRVLTAAGRFDDAIIQYRQALEETQ